MKALNTSLEDETLQLHPEKKAQLEYKIWISLEKIKLQMMKISEKSSELFELRSMLDIITNNPKNIEQRVRNTRAGGSKNPNYKIYFSSEDDQETDSIDGQ